MVIQGSLHKIFFFLNHKIIITDDNRHAEIAFGLIRYRVPCQCRALAWPFVVIKGKCVSFS